ncbi:hypothetical protein A1O3_00610 [Capronia epimyces CBS 606.96]|uniref:UBX domain-containing protein n=1 Tax=Capronia epimyces CBS 606.96 TaxID=1182542 RepID=W9YQW8_9EURO|nr:uncharacterized protein A1O3_00610 [Capronia epimyces CBS 606.96]EXJ92060.1 hypothetical protein A1O3_00610 [Capronia epimyces CBS 606.96]
MFHDGDIQSGIALALDQSKAVLCFVHDDSDRSRQWENVLRDASVSPAITAQTVALRLQAGSHEANFLSPICPISSTPAIVVIKNAQLQANLQSGEMSVHELKDRLISIFRVRDVGIHVPSESELAVPAQDAEQAAAEYLDLQPTAPGQMRLPNNAYDALRNYTQKLLDDGTAPIEVFQTQLRLLKNIPIFRDEVERLRGHGRPEVSEYLRSRLLRLPAVGLRIPGQAGPVAQPTTSSSSSSQQPPPRPAAPAVTAPVSGTASPAQQRDTASPAPGQAETEKQKAQRAEYIKMQREREQQQREERERIKAQIKADREERRRLDEMRKRGGNLEHTTSTTSALSGSTTSKTRNSETRVQVRTFDGSTLRSTFQPTSTLSADIRPWIDTTSNTTVPYNLKLILTPLPNRNIEASEEELPLSDLGIAGSCTLVMVPVRGYVESYTGSTAGGLLGAAVSGGYSLVSGTAGMVLGGVKSLLGYNTPPSSEAAPSGDTGLGGGSTPASAASAARNARVRTLADQRAESAGRDQQFYNGNQLNFQPKKDDAEKED